MIGNQTRNAFKASSMPCFLGEKQGVLLRKTDPSAASSDGKIIAKIHHLMNATLFHCWAKVDPRLLLQYHLPGRLTNWLLILFPLQWSRWWSCKLGYHFGRVHNQSDCPAAASEGLEGQSFSSGLPKAEEEGEERWQVGVFIWLETAAFRLATNQRERLSERLQRNY